MIENLNLKDRRILFELEQDSRQSLQQIAKKVSLKKETVFHRIKNLEKKGIIKKYITEIDVYKLGYQFYPLLIKYQNTTPKIEEEIYIFLRKHKNMAWLTKCEGGWDINLTLIANNNLEVNKFLEEFLLRYSKYISDKHLFITTEIHYFKRNFELNRNTHGTISTGGYGEINVDELDFKLLKILANDARKQLIDIGRELKTSAKNIAYRIKKLEKQKVIQGSRILVDFSRIGYKFHKVWFSLQDIDSTNFKKLIYYFQNHPKIIWATKTIGFYDLSIEMEVRDIEEFRTILDEIKLKFSTYIKKHESLLIFEEAVMNYLPS
ncbi:Lrp/AsnC family transcriptional regulator [Candidatus Pacearchaeota archaeon]|nr:Lrp/AsnC family transcriptional regulator [Candidatus Pacearchaeota archaeon]